MNIGLDLSFRNRSLKGDFYSHIFNNFVKFVPERFILKHEEKWNVKKWDEKKHRKLINDVGNEDDLIISNRNQIFSAGNAGTKVDNRFRSVELIQNLQDFNFYNTLIEQIISNEGFISAYIYDIDYTYVQSTVSANNLEGRNLSFEAINSIKNTPFFVESTGFKMYDVTYNPGRKELTGRTWLVPAWKMWFGEEFFNIVPKEHLLSFREAFEIKELSNGQVYVQLFEKMEESATAEAQEKQWAWRKWLDFDGLVKKYP